MIHSLTGTIVETHKDIIILDNGHNWSFTIQVCDSDRELGFVGRIYVHFHLRQDHMSLFGFRDREVCQLFKKLITVKGCGLKTAMNILNQCTLNEFIAAVETQDENRLLRLPGIGKKMAAQLILDLQGKLQEFKTVAMNPSYTHQVIQSLVMLGYKQSHCERVHRSLRVQDHHDETEFLKLMLQGLKQS